MERKEIEVLLTLSEELHFTRTAERLHLSTAAVSQIVRPVERRLGTALFARTTRHVELTDAGRQLLVAHVPSRTANPACENPIGVSRPDPDRHHRDRKTAPARPSLARRRSEPRG